MVSPRGRNSYSTTLASARVTGGQEAVAEDEAAYEATTHTAMEVPVELVPMVRELIAKQRAG
jgi:hypothetical protein